MFRFDQLIRRDTINGVSETVVRRMLDPKHNTKPERIQAALAALGELAPLAIDLRARLPEREALCIRLAFHYRRASWAPRVVTDEALLDLGPHLIDLAYWLSDSPLHRVRTVFRTKNRCTLELELGRARASLSCAADRPYAEVVEVRRANGRLLARRNKGGLARAALRRPRPALPAPAAGWLIFGRRRCCRRSSRRRWRQEIGQKQVYKKAPARKTAAPPRA
jgi:hypothetical protein